MPATVVGLDLSLTGTGVGVADFDILDDSPVFSCHRFGRKGKRNESHAARFARIDELAWQIRTVVVGLQQTPSLALIEDNPHGAQGGSAFDRAGLWWKVYEHLNQLGIAVLPVNVSKVKIYAVGKGTGIDKDAVLLAAARRYLDAPITNNDEADGWVLAAIGKRLLGEPLEASLPQTHLRALDATKDKPSLRDQLIEMGFNLA